MTNDQVEKIATPYERIGGDDAVLKLVTLFYDYMESLPEAKLIRDLHPKDMTKAREKLYMFLSGWLGGPDRYIAAFGHPRLRARHLPFPIGIEERDQWLMCMRKALDDMDLDAMFKQQLMSSFTQTANHMMNKELG